MLEIRKTAIALEEEDLVELERIVADEDREGTLAFLRKAVYRRPAASQQARLRSHLYSSGDPVEKFKKGR